MCWSIKNKEDWVLKKWYAFELWCWRRLLRVIWTARRSNQAILKEINVKYSLEGVMLTEALIVCPPDAKSCMCACSVTSVMSDSVTPWTVAHQAPLSMGFSRQEHWSGLPFPSPAIKHEELTHWKRPSFWERLRAKGEGAVEEEMFRQYHWFSGQEFEHITRNREEAMVTHSSTLA